MTADNGLGRSQVNQARASIAARIGQKLLKPTLKSLTQEAKRWQGQGELKGIGIATMDRI